MDDTTIDYSRMCSKIVCNTSASSQKYNVNLDHKLSQKAKSMTAMGYDSEFLSSICVKNNKNLAASTMEAQHQIILHSTQSDEDSLESDENITANLNCEDIFLQLEKVG